MENKWEKRRKERDDILIRIFKEENIVASTRSFKMFDIAWEHGHSEGEYSIRNWVRELKELLPEEKCCDECFVSYCSENECSCHKKLT